jgi:hypothetical protein
MLNDASMMYFVLIVVFLQRTVLNPLAVKTKINSTSTDRVFIEALVQNVTHGSIVMEKMNLVPSDVFQCRDMNVDENGVSVFQDLLK